MRGVASARFLSTRPWFSESGSFFLLVAWQTNVEARYTIGLPVHIFSTKKRTSLFACKDNRCKKIKIAIKFIWFAYMFY